MTPIINKELSDEELCEALNLSSFGNKDSIPNSSVLINALDDECI